MPATPDLVEELCRRHDQAKSGRSTLETTWERIAELYRPERLGFTSTPTPGNERLREVYDAIQIDCASRLASSMNALITPKGEAWVSITTEDGTEAEDDETTVWLEEASKVLLARMYDPAANLEGMLQPAYADIVTFGASPCLVAEPRPGAFLFRAYHLKDVHWLRDHAGRPDTVFATCELTVRQAMQRGWKGKRVTTLAEQRKLDEKVTFIEVTAPRYDFKPGSPLSSNRPWAFYVIEKAEKEVVEEGGFHEMPWLIPEWEALSNGDIWSPARRALADVRMLQQMGKTVIRQAQLAAEPPLLYASDGIMGPLRRTAGAMIPYDFTQLGPSGKVLERLDVAGDLAVSFEMIEAVREACRRAFLLDVIQLPDRANMTATEVLRHNRDLVRLTMSPFGRFETGLVQPLVERCFAILFRQSQALNFGRGSPFAPPPDALQGRDIKFKFFTEVARARQAAETAAIATVFESLGPLVQVKPDILDHLDTDELARDVIANQLSARYVKPMERVEAERKAQAAAIEEQQQSALALQQSQAVKNTAQAAQPFMQPGQAA